MAKMFVGQVVLACLLMMNGYAGGNGIGRFGSVTQAAGFSNSTLTGAYAFSGQSMGYVSQGSLKSAFVGVITLDGNGNIASGSMIEANEQFNTICTFSLSGTYSVNANGTGVATITASNAGAGCATETHTFALGLSGGANQVNLVETTLVNRVILSGVLNKQ